MIEQSPRLPSGFYFGIIMREDNMRVHGWLYADENRIGLLEAGSMPELRGKALRLIEGIVDFDIKFEWESE